MNNNNTKSKLDELKSLLDNDFDETHSTFIPQSTYLEDTKPKQDKSKKERQTLDKLNEQHLSFIHHYLITKDQTQAAILAGYSKKTAKTKGSLLMADPLIQQELKKEQNKIRSKWEIDRDFIVNEYMEQILYAKDLVIDGVTEKVKDSNLWLKATQSLSKTLGLDEPSKLDLTSKGKAININYIIPTDDNNENEENENEEKENENEE